ncbi:hypothetical protein BGW80DRAFT_1498430 [Lactifluus volemus]|nr:hypothetical protein BGW80DRAFT_1498430 [Lactifluus volemus]
MVFIKTIMALSFAIFTLAAPPPQLRNLLGHAHAGVHNDLDSELAPLVETYQLLHEIEIALTFGGPPSQRLLFDIANTITRTTIVTCEDVLEANVLITTTSSSLSNHSQLPIQKLVIARSQRQIVTGCDVAITRIPVQCSHWFSPNSTASDMRVPPAVIETAFSSIDSAQLTWRESLEAIPEVPAHILTTFSGHSVQTFRPLKRSSGRVKQSGIDGSVAYKCGKKLYNTDSRKTGLLVVTGESRPQPKFKGKNYELERETGELTTYIQCLTRQVILVTV